MAMDAAVGEAQTSHATRDDQSPHLGARIGDGWRLRAVLGTGGMATVYEAEPPAGGEIRAAKVMHPGMIGNVDLRRRFDAEAALMLRVDHPNAVLTYGTGVTPDGCPYYMMERLYGVTLESLLSSKGGQIPHDEGLLIADQLLAVLTMCHREGIIHRDIKPANVFLTREGEVKLIDFGVARVEGQEDQIGESGSRLGTPAYMPPEQAVNQTLGIDARSDIFAVGATLFRLLSGKRPREASSGEEAFILAATTPPPSIARAAPQLPLSVIRLIDRAMAWNPNDRFASAEAMRVDIAHVLAADESVDEVEPARQGSLKASLRARVAEDEDSLDEETKAEKAKSLRDLFRLMSSVFGTSMQYAWDHDQCTARREKTSEAFLDELARWPEGLTWTLRPYSFDYQGATVWEPDSAQDDIPYNLFSSGFREIRLRPSLTRDELDRFFRLMLTDPVRDLPPDDDLSTVYLESQFPGIDAALVTSFDVDLLLDKVEVQEELAQLRAEIEQQLAADLDEQGDVAQMMADLGQSALKETDALALDLEQSALDQLAPPMDQARSADALEVVRSRFEREHDTWDARTFMVLADAFEDARGDGDAVLVTNAFHERFSADVEADDAAGMSDVLLGAAEQLDAEALPPFLAGAITRGSSALLIRFWAGREPSPTLELVLDAMPPAIYPVLFGGFRDDYPGRIADALRSYVARNIEGYERVVGEALPGASEALASELIDLLASIDTPAARTALQRASKHPSLRIRLAAVTPIIHLASEVTASEVEALLRTDEVSIRNAVLELLTTKPAPGIAQRLVTLLRDPLTHGRPLMERQRMFMVLFESAPRDAEQLACEVVQRHGMFSDDQLDASRRLAVELLGTYGASEQALAAARYASRSWWWNTRALRESARKSFEQIERRLQGGA